MYLSELLSHRQRLFKLSNKLFNAEINLDVSTAVFLFNSPLYSAKFIAVLTLLLKTENLCSYFIRPFLIQMFGCMCAPDNFTKVGVIIDYWFRKYVLRMSLKQIRLASKM